MSTAGTAPMGAKPEQNGTVATGNEVVVMNGAGTGAGAGAGAATGAPNDRGAAAAPKQEVAVTVPAEEAEEEDFIVRICNVHKTYLLGIEGVPALRGVSLNIRRGEFVVILGKSGSGKTTMLNILGTIDTPTRGDLHLCGAHITPKTTDFQLAGTRLQSLGFVFQTFNLLPAMTAQENVEMPMVLAGVPASKRKKRATALLKRFGMGPRSGHIPSQLSGGEQQRVTIARALANSPELLLLDEPTGDLDSVNSDIVMRILMDLNGDEKVTLIMVTHDVALRNYAHRVVHMLDGKIQHVETVSEAARAQALAELHERTAAPDRTLDTKDRAALLAEAASCTKFRKPDFYSHLTA